MTELSLALLGSPVVQRNGIPATFDTRKATALLALLAVTGREHSREQLVDLLWPEADSVKGRASLRRTLSVTAAVMGPCLTISRTAVSLETDQVRVDVREFSRLIARADAASLEQAVQLYRDDFLAGFVLRGCPDFEDWQALVADELRQSLARGLQRLVAACTAAGELERKLAGAGHRENEERYRAFIASNPDAMWRMEFEHPIPLSLPEEEQIDRFYRDGYVAECNDAMVRLMGSASAEQFVGRTEHVGIAVHRVDHLHIGTGREPRQGAHFAREGFAEIFPAMAGHGDQAARRI